MVQISAKNSPEAGPEGEFDNGLDQIAVS